MSLPLTTIRQSLTILFENVKTLTIHLSSLSRNVFMLPWSQQAGHVSMVTMSVITLVSSLATSYNELMFEAVFTLVLLQSGAPLWPRPSPMSHFTGLVRSILPAAPESTSDLCSLAAATELYTTAARQLQSLISVSILEDNQTLSQIRFTDIYWSRQGILKLSIHICSVLSLAKGPQLHTLNTMLKWQFTLQEKL